MRFTYLGALALLACGPTSPQGLDDGATTTTTGSSSSSTTTGPDDSSTGDPDPTSTDTDTSTDTNTGFVPDHDFPNLDECDAFQQDCPEGEKCVPYASSGGSWDASKCVPVMGDQAPGEPCVYGGPEEATDDCDETSGCWDVVDVEGELIGTCLAFCTGTADDPMCPEGTQCTISGDGTITYCIFTCDPLLQDCNEGVACYWANSGFNCIFTTQDIPIGEPCGFINDCAKGLSCTNADVLPGCEGSACCTSWCDLEGPAGQCDALPGTECVAFFRDGSALPGYENVGICITPP